MGAFALAAFEPTLNFIRKLVRSNCLKKQRPAELESFDRPSLWYSLLRLLRRGARS